jgi:hypothetical protein
MTQSTNVNGDPERYEVLLRCAVLGVFSIIFMWGFWTSGVFALGINATIFLLGVAWVLYLSDENSKLLIRSGKVWMIPIGLMALSFALFENPFIKLVNLAVIPISWSLFYSAAVLSREKTVIWSPRFVALSILSTLLFPGCFALSMCEYASLLRARLHLKFTTRALVGRVLQGVGLLLALALFVVVPLLVSADTAFGERLLDLANLVHGWCGAILELSFLGRICCLVGVTCAVLGIIKLSRLMGTTAPSVSVPTIDSIVSGIVISGILAIYSLFIWVQFERLWFSVLPTQFSVAEQVAKGGFWQLVAISFINILLFTWCYRRTSPVVQGVLTAFTLACLVLVLSAANKMWLYVTTYGLSYEKFYASYTVLFCLIVFVALIRSLFTREAKDTVRFTCFSFLWMYGIVCVLPVEYVVLAANIELSKRAESRIDLAEMTMLSADVIGLAESNRSLLVAQAGLYRWPSWYARQNGYLATKSWFELNISNIWTGWASRPRVIGEACCSNREGASPISRL